MIITPSTIRARIAKGVFKPHTALTNMAQAWYMENNYFAKALFPICPVRQSSDNYYIFDKDDLMRDNWQSKPAYGKVMPAVLSEHTDTYNCQVKQMIMGVDDIRQTDVERRQAPAFADPRQQRTKTIALQANIHQDKAFANTFFKSGVWANEMVGTDSTTPTDNQFIKFSNGNSDPIKFIEEQKIKMQELTGRTPNKLALGVNVFKELKLHEGILERVKYGGTTANPAQVDKRVLAELFGVAEILVLTSTHNQSKLGKAADMKFIGDPNALLLCYATSTPSLEEPSAGYIFQWDMLGDGQMMPILNYPGENGTHSEYVEGLMAYDMRKTCDDLALFCKDVV